MDFSQKKPTRAEWESIEIPISENEKKIVQMICEGFSNLAIRNNPHLSLFTFIKISPSKEMEYALFQKYFEPLMENILKHASFPDAHHQEKIPKTIQKILQTEKENKQIQLKTADKIRIQNLDENIQKNQTLIFEFRLLELCQSLMAPLLTSSGNKSETKSKSLSKTKSQDSKIENKKTENKQVKPSIFYLYTLIQLKKATISHTNTYVLRFVDFAIKIFQTDHSMKYILLHSYECIEKNPYLFQYEDKSLFSHQKDLFQTFPASNRERSKLVLYIAPTGTGKTLSPIGLTEGHRVIFVCVARHIGFALAQTAVSVGKKIAFAFGCETADDIRLHNYSAKVFLKNRRTGGIGKIDHSVGDKVELMICDLQSYIPAMHYMLAFNQASDCITFWDEPTITLDVPLCASPLGGEDSDSGSPIGSGLGFGMSFSSGNLETQESPETQEIKETEIETERVEKKKTVPEMMKRLWNENRIPKMVLSCATLPKEEEILPMLADFRSRFDDAEIKTISSVDCRKSIAIINSQGYAVLPHTLFTDYRELIECVQYCEEDLTVTRYFDLREIIRFFTLLRDHQFEFWSEIDLSKEEMHKLGMKEVKQHYLNCLKMIPEEDWQIWQERFAKHSVARFSTTTTTNSQTQTQNGLRKIQSSGAATISETQQPQYGKPLSKIHSVDGSLMNFSSHPNNGNGTTNSIPVANPFAGILFSTHDAHTLTDGPTLYLAENVEKVGKFCISQANISSAVFQSIQAKIAHNDALAKQINEFETQLAAESAKKNASLGDEEAAKNGGESKNNGKGEKDNQIMELLRDKISLLRSQICNVSLDSKYIPNHALHLQIFAPILASDNHNNKSIQTQQEAVSKPFYCPLSEECVRQIMALDVESWMKLLLLMGIGIFPQTSEGRASEAQFQYLELIKGLANEQKLFLIIANSDYIYGTNYQFCHGILGKDLADMTQQKQKQAMGRIGRFNVQQEYTVRFRNDDLIKQLWMRPVRNVEAENMCFLFS